MLGEEGLDIDRMQVDGRVFSERHDHLTVSGNSNETVFEFVE